MGGCAGHSHDHEHSSTTFSLHPYIDHDQSYCLNESVPNSGVQVLRPHSERLLPVGVSSGAAMTVTSDPYDPDDVEDVELLLHVKFNEAVNMTHMCVCGRASLAEVVNRTDGNDRGTMRRTAAPKKCKMFANRTDLDFEMARELKGDMEVELLPPEHAIEREAELGDTNVAGGSMEEGVILSTLDYPVRGIKFQYCDNVTLYFGENYSSSLLENDEVVPTEVTYVGFKGVGTNVKRKAVETVYESRGMKKDHKVPDGEFSAKHSM